MHACDACVWPFLGFLPRRLTSLAGLRREKRRRGQRRCRWPEHQLRMLSHSTVRVGPVPSSRCSSTSCLRARTAVFSSICSSCGEEEGAKITNQGLYSLHPTCPGRVPNQLVPV